MRDLGDLSVDYFDVLQVALLAVDLHGFISWLWLAIHASSAL